MSGADFLWLVLQHVLPKGFRRARNFGFLHPNCKRLIALLHLLLKFVPASALAWIKPRAPIICTCCGSVMTIVRTRIRSVFPVPGSPTAGSACRLRRKRAHARHPRSAFARRGTSSPQTRLGSTARGIACAMAGVKRDLMCHAPRKAFTQRRLPKRYFLSEPISTRGPGSSNKRFRSRLRTI